MKELIKYLRLFYNVAKGMRFESQLILIREPSWRAVWMTDVTLRANHGCTVTVENCDTYKHWEIALSGPDIGSSFIRY